MLSFPIEQYAEIFVPLQDKAIGYLQGQHGNAGDGLIHQATLQLFDYFAINYTILNTTPWYDSHLPGVLPDSNQFDELVYFGGGNIGYPGSRKLRAACNELIRRPAQPVTLLPQSYVGQEELPYSRIFVREQYSLRLIPQARLQHDMALAFQFIPPVVEPAQQVGIFLRHDQESAQVQTIRGQFPDPAKNTGLGDFQTYLNAAAPYKWIITDRLHFAVAALLNKRQTILLPNAYFKNRGVWQHSLQYCSCWWANGLVEALQLIDSVENKTPNPYKP